MNIPYKVNSPSITLQKIGWGLIIIVLGKWIAAKQRNANTVPNIAPRLFLDPIIFSASGVNEEARLAKKSDLAKMFNMNNKRAKELSVFGFIKNA
jgi:hypothetical protein